MESFQTLSSEAHEKLKVADHLVSTTYPLVKEPKLLVSVVEDIFAALDLTMDALLEHEKKLSRMPDYGSSFEAKMDMFRRKIATKYGIGNDVMEFIMDLKKTVDGHKKSNVEFLRKDRFVISDSDYNLTAINIDDAKRLLLKGKHHVEGLLKILDK